MWRLRWRRRPNEQELREEIEGHLSVESARQAALRDFGNTGLAKEATRLIWGRSRIESVLTDILFGAKALANGQV